MTFYFVLRIVICFFKDVFIVERSKRNEEKEQ